MNFLNKINTNKLMKNIISSNYISDSSYKIYLLYPQITILYSYLFAKLNKINLN